MCLRQLKLKLWLPPSCWCTDWQTERSACHFPVGLMYHPSSEGSPVFLVQGNVFVLHYLKWSHHAFFRFFIDVTSFNCVFYQVAGFGGSSCSLPLRGPGREPAGPVRGFCFLCGIIIQPPEINHTSLQLPKESATSSRVEFTGNSSCGQGLYFKMSVAANQTKSLWSLFKMKPLDSNCEVFLACMYLLHT